MKICFTRIIIVNWGYRLLQMRNDGPKVIDHFVSKSYKCCNMGNFYKKKFRIAVVGIFMFVQLYAP